MSQSLKWIGFLTTVALTVLVGFNIVREADRQDDAHHDHVARSVDYGIELFALHCVECHGADGQGLDDTPSLDQPFVAGQDDRILYTVIERGRYNTEMTAFGLEEGGFLNPQQINALVHVVQQAPWDRVEARVDELGLRPVATAGDDSQPITFEGDAATLEMALPLYQETCAECHGDTGGGTDQGPQLNNRYVRGLDAQVIFDNIKYGVAGTEMEAFSEQFSDDQIVALVYLLHNWDAIDPTAVAGALVDDGSVSQTGAELFGMWCAPCHGAAGEGSAVAPALNDVPFIPADFIESRVRGGLNAMPAFDPVSLPDAALYRIIQYAQENVIGSGVPDYSAEEMALAQALYVEHCAECHGDVGQGVEDKGTRITTTPPMHRDEIVGFTRVGSANTPPITQAQVSDRELALIVAYVHSLSEAQ